MLDFSQALNLVWRFYLVFHSTRGSISVVLAERRVVAPDSVDWLALVMSFHEKTTQIKRITFDYD